MPATPFKLPLAGLFLALTSCASTVPMTPPTQAELTRAGELHQAVNSLRRSKGLDALQRHEGLDQLARKHSEFMRVNRGKFTGTSSPNLSHEGFEYRCLVALRVHHIASLAENVAYCPQNNQASVSALIKAWIDSKIHRENMTSQWAVTGVGIQIDDDGTVFATQLYGSAPHAPSQREFFNQIDRRF